MMESIPLHPEVMDGLALEDGYNNICETPCDHKDYSAPQETLSRLVRENADIEEQQRQLQQCQLRKVVDGHDVEELEHRGDLFRLQSPDVLAKTMLDSAVHGDNCTGNGRYQGREHGPVIIADVLHSEAEFVGKPSYDECSSDGYHHVGKSDIALSTVANRRATIGQTDVSRCYE